MPDAIKPPFPQYFGLKNGRTSFLVNPSTDAKDLFGAEYQTIFAEFYTKMEERSYSNLGYKAVIWGDFGLGKTHFLKHLQFSIGHAADFELPPIAIYPVYIKLHALNSKAPFADFAAELVRAIGTEELGNITTAYVNAHGMAKINELAASESIAIAFEVMARFPGRARQHAIRWICGEKLSAAEANNIETAAGRISGQVVKGKEFGSILQIVALMVSKSKDKVLTYFIDEAERLESITDPNAYAQWLDCLRGLTELDGLGAIFAVGSATRDNVPGLLTEQEIEGRIGPTGYRQLENLAESDIRDFIKDALTKMRDRGSASAAHGLALSGETETIWPFNEPGFEAFVEYCRNSPLANRPREILNALQNLSARCYREDKKTIDANLISAVLVAA